MRFFLLLFITTVSLLQANPKQNLKRLMEGNRNYARGQAVHSNQDEKRRVESSIAQFPFAVVLGCSDSRVPPEIIFDQGIGDLFVVRVAGNVVGAIELASIHYAVSQLGSSVILVLGHESCGAIKAVVEGKTQGIEPIARLIAPAIQEAKKEKGVLLENAIKENVEGVVDQLKANKELAEFINSKKLVIAGGYYNFHSGKVEIID